MQSDHRMREVLEAEVFPNRQLPPGTPPNIATLDLTYYPEERGPYNYDTPDGVPGYSSGLSTEGLLNEPETRWGGIQRALTTTDFEMSNVQFIQFWVMDPFNDDSENINGGDLYFNLGNVSEDVLNDSHLSFENGFPTDNNPLPTLKLKRNQLKTHSVFMIKIKIKVAFVTRIGWAIVIYQPGNSRLSN